MLDKDQIGKVERIHKELGSLLEKHYTEKSGYHLKDSSPIQPGRHVTDVNFSWIDQSTFGELVQSLSTPSHSYTYNLNPPGLPAFLDFALPVRNYLLELNGITKAEGLVTDEERAVMTQYTRQTLADLEEAWSPVDKLSVTDATIEQDPANLTIAQRGDSVVLIAYECHMQHANGHIRIAYPTRTLEPLLDKLDAWSPEA